MKYFYCIVLFFSFLPNYAQTVFNKIYGSDTLLESNRGIVSTLEGYLSIGSNWDPFGGDGALTLIHCDEFGEIIWEKKIGEPHYQHQGGDVIKTSDGGYVLFNTSVLRIPPNADYHLVKINEKGEILWRNTFGLGSKVDASRKVIQSSDGGFVLTGFSQNFPDEKAQAFIVKTDSLGNREWRKHYGALEYADEAVNVIETEDGGFVVVGSKLVSEQNRNIWLFKIDALGKMLWEKDYGGFYYEASTDFVEVEDGYIIVGVQFKESTITGDSNAYVLKTDFEGNKLWEKSYGGRFTDQFAGVHLLEDGSLIVSGSSRNYEEVLNNHRGMIMKLTAEGDSIWGKIYGSTISPYYLWDIKPTNDGGFISCGMGRLSEWDSQDGWILKVDSLGNTCQPANCDSIFTTSIQYEVTTHYPTSFYPNPAQNRVTFQHRLPKGKEAVLEVYDLQGELMVNCQLLRVNEELVLEVEDWESGLYLYRVSIGGEEVSSGKLVVE